MFGKTLALPQGPHYTRLGSPMILELLWSPRNGWLVDDADRLRRP